MSIGAYHYHARQALMGWDSAFLTIFQNLADIRELLCSPAPPGLADRLLRGETLHIDCECQMQCLKWHVVSEVLEHMFHSRITIYEMEYVARACGFSLEDLEEDLVANDLLMSPISFAVLLDDINILQKIEQAVKESDLVRTVECLGTVAEYLSDNESVSFDVFAVANVLLRIGRLPTKLTQWFAFGSPDMVDTCVNDIPVKPFVENMERWDSMKRDLKNVTEAMVGILPPEDVVNRFTSFLDSKNSRKKKNFRSNSTATTT